MIIGDAERFSEGKLSGVRWKVSWENSSRPDVELYIAVSSKHANLIAPNDHTSLLSALPTAARYQEKEIRIPSADPVLIEGLEAFQEYYKHWQGFDPVHIVPATTRPVPAVGSDRSTAVFFTGGIDSLASLRRNTDRFPTSHPGRITHALHVDLAGPLRLSELNGDHRPQEESMVDMLEKATNDVGVEVVSVVTNIRGLDNYDFDWDWMAHSHGTVFAAVGHAFEPAFSRVLIASSYDVAHLIPWGSHPMSDSRLRSSTFTFTHHNEQFTRQEKVNMVADWEAGMDSLDICFRWFDRAAGARNCGECEKCQRTIAQLMIAGVDVDGTGAFEKTTFNTSTVELFGLFVDEYERESWQNIEIGLRKLRHPATVAVAARIRRDRLARLVDNRYGRPLHSFARRGYKLLRKLR